MKKRPKTDNESLVDELNNLSSIEEFDECINDEFEDLNLPGPKEFKKEKDFYIKEFTIMIESLETISEKQKKLWIQIYQNAVIDRMNAYISWNDLYSRVYGNANEHALHGQNLARYMERMSKSNEQLLKLSEQISLSSPKKTDTDSVNISDDDIYSKLEKESKIIKN